MSELAKAVIKVMQAVEGIEKNMTVGTGNSSYKGVSDQDVKKIIGKEMAKNGLILIPISVTPNTSINRYTETYNGSEKQKTAVFTEVVTKYKLLHISGESEIIEGYGHGTDTQDKSAGKATTYALKYALLYTFLVPTGSIDDADNTHSDTYESAPAPQKPWLNENTPEFEKSLNAIKSGKYTIADIRKKYAVSKKVENLLK